MELSKLRAGPEGYLIDPDTGRRVKFYLCDPEKNTICDHAMCRYPCQKDDDSEIGFCVSTPSLPFAGMEQTLYFRLNHQGQYVQEWVEAEDDDDQE